MCVCVNNFRLYLIYKIITIDQQFGNYNETSLLLHNNGKIINLNPTRIINIRKLYDTSVWHCWSDKKKLM